MPITGHPKKAGQRYMNESAKVNRKLLNGGVAQLDIKGSIDRQNCSIVADEISKLFESKIYKIIINLKDTSYISSSGFGILVAMSSEAVKNKGEIVFVSTPDELKEIFEILGITRLLKFAANVQEGISIISGL